MRLTSRSDAHVAGERAVIVGLAEKGLGAGVAERVRCARAGRASPSGTHPRQATKVTSCAGRHVGIATLAIHRIARVLGAFVSVVAIDAGAEHRVFTDACGADARKTAEVASGAVYDVRRGRIGRRPGRRCRRCTAFHHRNRHPHTASRPHRRLRCRCQEDRRSRKWRCL